MKCNIDISKYVNKNGKFDIENNSFRHAFSILELKHINMLLRINRINELCNLHFQEWKKKRKNFSTTDYQFAFLQEEIIYHMRRVVDDVISITWIQNEFDNERYVSKIQIDSIGKYLKQHNRTMNCYDDCIDFLCKLNEISNSYKHSVFQTVQIFVDKNGPGFYVYNYQSNDTNKEEKQVFYFQSDILESFEKMLSIYFSIVYEETAT